MSTESSRTAEGFIEAIRTLPERRAMWRTNVTEPMMVLRERCINVISCANVRSNVGLSLRMVLEMAAHAEEDAGSWTFFDDINAPTECVNHPLVTEPRATKPGDPPRIHRALYLNAYASDETLAEHFRRFENELPALKERQTLAEAASKADGVERSVMSGLPVAYIDIPLGQFTEQAAKIEKTIKANCVDTVVLNSFEYAICTARQKRRMAEELIRWNRELKVTVIVFTSDARRGMAAGIACRGPIGDLLAVAEAFWWLDNDGRVSSSRIARDTVRNAEHEFRTHTRKGIAETNLETAVEEETAGPKVIPFSELFARKKEEEEVLSAMGVEEGPKLSNREKRRRAYAEYRGVK